MHYKTLQHVYNMLITTQFRSLPMSFTPCLPSRIRAGPGFRFWSNSWVKIRTVTYDDVWFCYKIESQVAAFYKFKYLRYCNLNENTAIHLIIECGKNSKSPGRKSRQPPALSTASRRPASLPWPNKPNSKPNLSSVAGISCTAGP